MKEIYPGIVVDPDVHSGTPILKGTQVTIRSLLGHLAADEPVEDIARHYGVTTKEVLLCVIYARIVINSRQVRGCRVTIVPSPLPKPSA